MLASAAFGAVPPAQKPSQLDDELILIRADRAWEATAQGGGDSGAQVLHLEGNFEMRGPDWRVTANSAQVHGPLDDPSELIILGAPASIVFTDADGDATTGQGGRIVYWRWRDLLELHVNAVLKSGDLSVSGSKIIYDLEAERLQSSGEDGIEFVLSGQVASDD